MPLNLILGVKGREVLVFEAQQKIAGPIYSATLFARCGMPVMFPAKSLDELRVQREIAVNPVSREKRARYVDLPLLQNQVLRG